MFIPDPAALQEGTQLLRELRFRLKRADGDIIIPRVRIEHRASKSTFQVRRRKRRRRNVPLVRPHQWAYRETMKKNFSRKIRDIIVMVAGVRGHRNLTLWRDAANLMIWHGECRDCGMTLWVGPGYWKLRPGTLRFRGMMFVDECPNPQQPTIKRVAPKPPAPPFSRLLAGRR
jgi:hypothetical protein